MSAYRERKGITPGMHNEFYRPDPPPSIDDTDADLIVLAGDIGVVLDGLRWAVDEAGRLGKSILYVAGNHEFYHHDIALPIKGAVPFYPAVMSD